MNKVALATFFWELDPLADVLVSLDQKGVKLVEIHSNAPGTHIDMSDDAQVESVLDVMTRLPIRVRSVHSGFSRPSAHVWDISNPDVTIRQKAIRRHQDVFRASARLGAYHVALHPGPQETGKDRLQAARQSISELSDTAREVSIKIAIENLTPGHIGASIEDIKFLLDGTDPDIVGLCLDTGHAGIGSDSPVDYIKVFSGRLIAVHWHDCHQGQDAHRFPGMGDTHWQEFFNALQSCEICPRFTLEALPTNEYTIAEGIEEIEQAILELRHPSFE